MPQPPDQRVPVLFLVLVALVALLVVAWDAGREQAGGVPAALPDVAPAPAAPKSGAFPPLVLRPGGAPVALRPSAPAPTLPGGGTRIFQGGRFLVAYYGTAQTPALGVLGESAPDTMDRRLRRAAAPFHRATGRPVRRVYELIVTIADGHPGKDGDYSHDIPRAAVRRYINAAHRNGALLLLDIQPGRSNFLEVARRWEWALRDPAVGLALDPEWRMGRRQVPGRVIGRVGAAEVNRTSAWLSQLSSDAGMPEKLFVLHQFRVDMIRNIAKIVRRPGLAMVQHVDGFGTPGQKRDTFHAVARPGKFAMGFKLFYDEDIHRMSAREVNRLRPRVRFVSYQ